MGVPRFAYYTIEELAELWEMSVDKIDRVGGSRQVARCVLKLLLLAGGDRSGQRGLLGLRTTTAGQGHLGDGF